MDFWGSLALILGLVLLSGLFSSSETALTSISSARVRSLELAGNRRAALVARLRERKESLIGAILLGNNAVNIAASSVATAFAIRYFGHDAVALSAILLTLLVLIFGEVAPKTYAIQNPERVALAVAPLFAVLVKVFSPITSAVQALVSGFFFIIRLRNEAGERMVSAADALRGAIDLHHSEGSMARQDKDMLGAILDLAETHVEEIMVHRRHVETIDASQPPAALYATLIESGHSRMPLWREDPENILGLLHVKDAIRAVQAAGGSADRVDFAALATPPWFIPTSTTLKEQLHAFRSRRQHFAFVVDEYGAFQGIVTLEDVLEEIVGDIDDEHDFDTPWITAESDGRYVVDGQATLRDVNRKLVWNLPDEHASTLAGLIIHEAERIPEVGEVFRSHGGVFEIIAREGNQITRLRVYRVSGPDDTAESPADA